MGPISRRPWTRQPQGTLRIERNNALGRRVLTAHVRGVNVARGGPSAWSGTPGLKAADVGLLSSFDGSSYQDLKFLADMARPVTIAYFLRAASPPTYMGVAKISGTTGSNAFVIIRSTDAAYRLSCGYTDVGSIPLFGGVSNSFDGVAERTVITCAGGLGSSNSANYIAWINGTSFASVGGATFTNQSNDNSYLGWDGVDSKTSGLLDEFIIFDGVLSDLEIKSYYANPWQVFAPRRRLLVDVASGGGTATITGAGGIASAEAFGTAAVSSGTVKTVTGAGAIASGEAFGTATVTWRTNISAAGGIASAGAFGNATVTWRATVVPAGIASGEAFGAATVTFHGLVAPTGIASGEAFGTATFVRDGVVIARPPTHIHISISLAI